MGNLFCKASTSNKSINAAHSRNTLIAIPTDKTIESKLSTIQTAPEPSPKSINHRDPKAELKHPLPFDQSVWKHALSFLAIHDVATLATEPDFSLWGEPGFEVYPDLLAKHIEDYNLTDLDAEAIESAKTLLLKEHAIHQTIQHAKTTPPLASFNQVGELALAQSPIAKDSTLRHLGLKGNRLLSLIVVRNNHCSSTTLHEVAKHYLDRLIEDDAWNIMESILEHPNLAERTVTLLQGQHKELDFIIANKHKGDANFMQSFAQNYGGYSRAEGIFLRDKHTPTKILDQLFKKYQAYGPEELMLDHFEALAIHPNCSSETLSGIYAFIALDHLISIFDPEEEMTTENRYAVLEQLKPIKAALVLNTNTPDHIKLIEKALLSERDLHLSEASNLFTTTDRLNQLLTETNDPKIIETIAKHANAKSSTFKLALEKTLPPETALKITLIPTVPKELCQNFLHHFTQTQAHLTVEANYGTVFSHPQLSPNSIRSLVDKGWANELIAKKELLFNANTPQDIFETLTREIFAPLQPRQEAHLKRSILKERQAPSELTRTWLRELSQIVNMEDARVALTHPVTPMDRVHYLANRFIWVKNEDTASNPTLQRVAEHLLASRQKNDT